MTIKSDRWIRQQCTPPEKVILVGNYTPQYTVAMLRIEDIDPQEFFEEYRGKRPEMIKRLALMANKYPEVLPYELTEEEIANWKPMIEPFSPELVREANGEKIVSYGTSSYGYDIRCGREFKIFTNINSTIVDPKNFDPNSFVEVVGDYCIIPPNSFALARTMEYLRIPRNVLTVCLGKSTYARCGIVVNVTPFEPEWQGFATLEFSNTTPLPAKIYAGEGCAQVLFFESDEECETSYKDRNGKYQCQGPEPIPPKL